MANGSRHSIYSVEESTYGTTPNNPALDLVRITGTTLGLAKDSLQSEEIRSDRQIADFRQGANQVGGDINFELSYGSFDQFLEAVLLSADWAAPADTGVTTLSQSATQITRASGSFVTDGFEVGQTAEVTGFAGSGANGTVLITAVAALALDVTALDGQTLAVEAGDGDEQVVANPSIKAGTERRSFTFVRHFADIQTADNPYYIYRGVELNSVQFTIAANSMVTGTFSIIGQSQETAQDLTGLGTPTYNPASTTSPLDSFTGSLQEGGTTVAVVTEISMTLQNGIEPRFVVGSKNSIYPSIGRSNLTGQVTAYFEDSDLVNKFLNETESSLVFTLPDGAGNQLRVTIPRIKYTGGQPDVSGEGPITLAMPFQALLDSTESSNIRIERIPV
jgi:hypothetical protein